MPIRRAVWPEIAKEYIKLFKEASERQISLETDSFNETLAVAKFS